MYNFCILQYYKRREPFGWRQFELYIQCLSTRLMSRKPIQVHCVLSNLYLPISFLNQMREIFSPKSARMSENFEHDRTSSEDNRGQSTNPKIRPKAFQDASHDFSDRDYGDSYLCCQMPYILSLYIYIFFRLKEIKHTRARYDKRAIVEATATRKSIDLTL